MSVIIYIDHPEGKIKKNSLEAICYGSQLAKKMNTEAIGVILGSVLEDPSILGAYGLQKIQQSDDPRFDYFDVATHAAALKEIIERVGANCIIFSNNSTGKALAPFLSAKIKAGLVTSVTGLPDLQNGFVVKKNVFSGKAFAAVKINTPIRIISLNQNAIAVEKSDGKASIEKIQIAPIATKTEIISTQKTSGSVPLGEAERVVSGGRGLKGPEHWGMVEELAKELEAATACSRPVADEHWRPHHEHVGQTGLAISPNLYIAIGISGAIQHLAGVNRSKVIVVINKDPEAPFFKAADYGVVGDAFVVVPKLIESLKKMKG
ncbi:MAG: electron transfer flavoprotein subunit alpha/FixB family protein [Chitinophagaceae bacterium]